MGRISDALRKMDDHNEDRRQTNKSSVKTGDSAAQSSQASTRREREQVNYNGDFPKVLFGEISPLIFVYYDVSQEAIEEMRHICSTLLSLPERLFMFTSAQPSEGKTIALINTSMALAKHFSQKVLYIDADMRAPESSLSYLDLPERKLNGFSDVLSGDVEPDEAVISTEIDGLFLMPRGKKIALDRVSSDFISSLLFKLKNRFDFVFVDAPPVRAFSDPRLIARGVEAVVVVVRMNNTPRGSVKHAVQLLRDSSSVPIYFILNAVHNYVPGRKTGAYY